MTINEMKQSYKQSYTDNVELSIFNCGHEYCQPGHTWGPGVRDHYLIHLVVAGKGVYQVNGASHTLQEGDLFLAKPNQLITYAADETDPWEYYWVGFNGACANKLVQQTPFSRRAPRTPLQGPADRAGGAVQHLPLPRAGAAVRGPDDGLSVYLYGAPDEGGPRGDAQRRLVQQSVRAGRHQVYPVQLLA